MATQKSKFSSNQLVKMKIETEKSRPSLIQIVKITRTVAKKYRGIINILI